MKKILSIMALGSLLVACAPAEGDIAEKETAFESLIDSGSDVMDSLQTIVDEWVAVAFDKKEEAVKAMKDELDKLQPNGAEFEKARVSYEQALKEFEEEKTKFLTERKETLRALGSSANEIIAAIDEQIGELNKVKKDPIVTPYAVTETIFKDYFSVKGNVEAKFNAQVFPEMSGTVTRIMVEKGQQVSKGQALVELDTEIIEKQIAEIESSLALARDLYERQKNLWNQSIGSEVQYLEAKNRVESLENTKATLKEQMSMGVVRAPFSGILDELNPKVGEMASPAFPIGRIVNLDEIYLEADVSENHYGDVRVGNEVLVTIQDVKGFENVPAKITRTGSYIKPDNRTFEIRVDFDKKQDLLIPNLVADLKVNEYKSDTLQAVLPYSMILEDASGQDYVWVLEPSEKEDRMMVSKRLITKGSTYNDMTLISEGLKKGDVIIDKGARRVRDGILVRVQNGDSEIASK